MKVLLSILRRLALSSIPLAIGAWLLLGATNVLQVLIAFLLFTMAAIPIVAPLARSFAAFLVNRE